MTSYRPAQYSNKRDSSFSRHLSLQSGTRRVLLLPAIYRCILELFFLEQDGVLLQMPNLRDTLLLPAIYSCNLELQQKLFYCQSSIVVIWDQEKLFHCPPSIVVIWNQVRLFYCPPSIVVIWNYCFRGRWRPIIQSSPAASRTLPSSLLSSFQSFARQDIYMYVVKTNIIVLISARVNKVIVFNAVLYTVLYTVRNISVHKIALYQ